MLEMNIFVGFPNNPAIGQWFDFMDYYGYDEDDFTELFKNELGLDEWIFSDSDCYGIEIEENESLDQIMALMDFMNTHSENEDYVKALGVYQGWSSCPTIVDAIDGHEQSYIGYFEDNDELLESILPEFMAKLDELSTPCNSTTARSLIDIDHLVEIMAMNAYDIIEVGHRKHYVWSKI